jgi:hypothetical protein
MPDFSRGVRPLRRKLQVPLRYRAEGGARWNTGRTENISQTGLLFYAETLVPLHSNVELVLILPARLLDAAPAELVCAGKVTRVVSGGLDGQSAIGVEFYSMAAETIETLLARL